MWEDYKLGFLITQSVFKTKGAGETKYPVRYVLWRRKKKERIDQKDSLDEVSGKSSRIELQAYPSDEKNKLSPRLTLPEKFSADKNTAFEQMETEWLYLYFADARPEEEDRL